ncbi:uncharacterized protein PAC_16753 [Phialocephala subalpina]|uniref:Uncharacterized protein n=1 Tax=Phialocephala subalpina TaxID=576137 RepID=A0A1L7XPB2_9HELO|nr:uncharacterized protein PAC_16753 [Phialocephala subalpina]
MYCPSPFTTHLLVSFHCLLSDVYRELFEAIISNLTATAMESIPDFAHTSACASELFLGFNKTSSNVTELCSQLAQCPGFCETTFETENLDLAGKGICISTIIKGSLAIVIGTIFPTFIYLARTLPIRPLVPRIPLLQDIKRRVHRVSLFFSLCILTSIALQNARTSRPVLETGFLSWFLGREMYIMSTFHWGIIADKEMNSNPLLSTQLAYLAMTFAHLYLSFKVSVPHQSFYRILDHECPRTAQGLEIKPYFGTGESAGKQFYLLVWPFGLAAGAGPLFFLRFKNELPGWLRRHGGAIGWTLIMMVFAGGIMLNNRRVGDQTQLVRMMRRKDLPSQNDWDFGQSTALMIWLLVASEPLAFIRKWRNPQVTTLEEETAAEAGKAVETPVTDEKQRKLGNDAGELTLVDHDVPGRDKAHSGSR